MLAICSGVLELRLLARSVDVPFRGALIRLAGTQAGELPPLAPRF